MNPLRQLGARIVEEAAALQRLRLGDLVFDERGLAVAVLIVLAGLSLGTLLWRAMHPGSNHRGLALPAIVTLSRSSVRSVHRHIPWVLVVAGMPFFAIALTAPYSALTQQQVSYAGRRIAILIDGSSSMTAPFELSRLSGSRAPENLFTTNIQAAEAFIRQRMNGRYRDLIALIEFGNHAYVITPFTSDYDNVLLSISLIGQWEEYERFPDLGTTIGTAIQQAVNLFKAFNYLDAAGNAMVIFSDGQDTEVSLGGKTVRQVMTEAAAAGIPVYFVRCGLNRQLGDIVPDSLWQPAAEFTGGRFYAAANEQDVLEAIADIDRRVTGMIDVTQYAVRQPQFTPFALAASAFWLLALLAKLLLPYLSTLS